MTQMRDSGGIYIAHFTDEEIERARLYRRAKDSIGWGDHFASPNRWTGKLGEDATERFFIERKIPYRRVTKRSQKDLLDFIVGDLYLDAKTVNTQVYPQNHYGAEVAKSQIGNRYVNSYIFGRYILPRKCVILLGWLKKEEFIKASVIRTKGEKVTNAFTSRATMLEVAITDLHPMSSLCNGSSTF